ncbi:MAG: AEC family transporter [Verrucomicrobiae bacterium]|nr:AEC family transporter [Verrucomicrobiae bacterium]
MNEFFTVLNTVLPIFATIGLGALIRRLGWLTREADASLSRITINLLFPCLIFESLLGNRALDDWSNLLLAPALGLATLVLGFGAGWIVGRWVGGPIQRRTFAFNSGIYNYSYLPLPITLALFDRATVGVLFVFNLGIEVAIWTIGLAVLTGGRSAKDWRKFFNAPLVAVLLGVALHLLGVAPRVPSTVTTCLRMLGDCAIPVALLLIGAVALDFAGDARAAAGGARTVVAACVLRLAVFPFVFLAFARWLPGSVELKRVLVLQAAMPAAVFPIVMARHYGGDVATALRVVVATSLAGLATIPFWISAGLGGMPWLR